MTTILLDQNIPFNLRFLLADFDVKTAWHMGWSQLSNGDLIAAAEAAAFDVMITADRNLKYQQNIGKRHLAVIVLSSNDWSVLRGKVDAIAHAIGIVEAGQFLEVSIASDHVE